MYFMKTVTTKAFVRKKKDPQYKKITFLGISINHINVYTIPF